MKECGMGWGGVGWGGGVGSNVLLYHLLIIFIVM